MFVFNLYALEVRTFCFSNVSASQVKSSIQDLLLPKDNVEIMGTCLQAAGTTSRLDVIEALIGRQYQYKRTDLGSSQDSEPVHCRLEVEKISSLDHNQRNIGLGQNNEFIDRSNQGHGREVSTLTLTPGRKGSLRYQTQMLDVICIKRGEKFELEFSLTHANGGTSTTVMLSAGEKMNVAGVVRDLNDKNTAMGIPHGVSHQDSQGSGQIQYYLTVR